MKLLSIDLTLQEKLEEFDTWITASIQEVNETQTYRKELAKITKILESLGAATSEFESVGSCNAGQMAVCCILEVERLIAGCSTRAAALAEAVDLLDSLISMLFLVTGKSDNNMKCQFPVYLYQSESRTIFPFSKRLRGGQLTFEHGELGRVIKQDKVARLIAETLVLRDQYTGEIDLEAEAVWLLKGYISSILDSEGSVDQLWALGSSYFSLKNSNPGMEGNLLAPIVAFKVRGAVAAQSGHLPEKILRRFMTSWGLKAGVDFNLDDVVVRGGDLRLDDLRDAAVELNEVADSGKIVNDLSADPTKTRAYDFVLPYSTPGWVPRIFMQSQFYAGDSGSVSHKVVDQTRASRILTRAKYPHAVFIEFLDGAGYFSSLHRDLKHMLEMPSTSDFIQVRTAHTKLRRSLQAIGYLTPLDFVHSLIKADGQLDKAITDLINDGYAVEEVTRCHGFCVAESHFLQVEGQVKVAPRLLVNSRRMLLLDIVLLHGSNEVRGAGSVVVKAAGLGAGHGIGLQALGRFYQKHLSAIDAGATRFSLDLEWLHRNSFIQIKSL